MKTHMLEEILEQPQVVDDILKKYLSGNDILIDLPAKISQLRLVASGSSYHVSVIIANLIKEKTDLDVSYDYSSEFILRNKFSYDKDTLYVFISQSGETSDTVCAMRKVKECGVKTMAITNVKNSTLWNETDYQIDVCAGEEKSIASTKAVTAQVLCMYLMVAKYLKSQNDSSVGKLISDLKDLPATMQKFIDNRELLQPITKVLSEFNNIAILGDSIFYAIALEMALKMKETSYINVNTYPIGEFLHGHMAVLNNKGAIIALLDERNLEANIKILKKAMKDYNPTVVTVSESVDDDAFDFNFHMDKTPFVNRVFNTLLLLQITAYQVATALGRDIDNPKGLSKVVQV